MMFVGYPIGFMVLKTITLGRASLGPWNNNGKPYDLSFGRFFKSDAGIDIKYTFRTEFVAVVGWMTGWLVAVTALVYVNR
jgi:hypothetical protein